jgi:NAD(P)H-hydrate repair Nnr-like enzyme with NAD(P)H-hydrate epimerase domain
MSYLKQTEEPQPTHENEASFVAPQTFYTLQNYRVPAVTLETFHKLISELQDTFYVTETQICESAAYSMSMVVRHALGLSAEGGVVSILVTDGLLGRIALNTARYLAHAGAACHILLIGSDFSKGFKRSLHALEALCIPVQSTPNLNRVATWLETALTHSQHLVLGIAPEQHTAITPQLKLINEAICPVHCLQLPPGIHPDAGTSTATAIFASSTLSLGVPLNGIALAREHVGRHYLCDISLPARVLDENDQEHPLFADQPVQSLLFECPKSPH